MRSTRSAIAGLFITVLTAASAQAQAVCPEGRAPGGGCVDPVLAGVMRQGTVIATHPKISATVPLNMPSEDAYYTSGRQRFEYVRIYGPKIPQINNPYDYQINIPAMP
jgi:hypothetical protein